MAQGYGAARSPFVVVSLLVLLSACVAARTPSNLARTTATEAGTPLMAAAASGDLERVRGLAESGHPLNALTERGTPLMAAVRAGRDRVAWYLLTQGADPDLASANGETPLMAASAADACAWFSCCCRPGRMSTPGTGPGIRRWYGRRSRGRYRW